MINEQRGEIRKKQKEDNFFSQHSDLSNSNDGQNHQCIHCI